MVSEVFWGPKELLVIFKPLGPNVVRWMTGLSIGLSDGLRPEAIKGRPSSLSSKLNFGFLGYFFFSYVRRNCSELNNNRTEYSCFLWTGWPQLTYLSQCCSRNLVYTVKFILEAYSLSCLSGLGLYSRWSWTVRCPRWNSLKLCKSMDF